MWHRTLQTLLHFLLFIGATLSLISSLMISAYMQWACSTDCNHPTPPTLRTLSATHLLWLNLIGLLLLLGNRDCNGLQVHCVHRLVGRWFRLSCKQKCRSINQNVIWNIHYKGHLASWNWLQTNLLSEIQIIRNRFGIKYMGKIGTGKFSSN